MLSRSPYLVSRTRFWTTPGTLSGVGTYFRQHPENGLMAQGEGSTRDRTGVVSVSFLYGELQIAIAPVDDRTVGIRADAVVLWYPAKPTKEHVPAGVRSAEVLVYSHRPDRALARRTITGAKAQQLAALANALRRDIRGKHGCPDDFGRRIRITFTTDNGPAVLDGFFCDSIDPTVNGEPQPPLMLSKELSQAIDATLGPGITVGPN